ncbi:MAG: error-prone DNA polymerase [Kangiellaceae bacterium]
MQYYELNTTTNFSFLKGASHPEELIKRAFELGYHGMAITDECSLAGIVRAHVEVKKQLEVNPQTKPFKLIIGSCLKIDWQENCQMEVVIISPCREAYAELSSLISCARRRAEKGSYQVKLKDLSQYLSLCLCIWLPTNDYQISYQQLALLTPIFDGKLWIGYARLLQANDYEMYLHCLKLAQAFNLPMVAQNHVLMHTKKRLKLHHCLTAIRKNSRIQELGNELISNAEQSLRSINNLQRLYPIKLLIETNKIAEQCNFSLDELKYEYPDEVLPKNLSVSNYLAKLSFQGANKRWPNGISNQSRKQLERELKIIKKLKYEHYFLTVHDIVQFARKQKILCQGRGSAANSIVCYCLFITEVSPEQSSMLFERFISEERKEPPDIDVDFEHQRREEVIQYIYKKYTRERAALAATVITYRLKSAIRDVGKALGIDLPVLEHLSKSMAWWDKPESLQEYFKTINFSYDGILVKEFFELTMSILKFPRHLSQHVGGFIITRRAMSTLVPVENASMPDRTVIQWDKYDIEALGLLKIDVLGLGMLTMIRKCLETTSSYSNIAQLSDIKKEDKLTYNMICNSDTVGVFQIESRAQMSMLPRLRPQNFYDLVIQIAIVRPGPIQGNMVHPYLKRRNKEEQPDYVNAQLKKVLERTLGVPIFQEQVIQIAMVAAGFSGGEADQLRRAMATWGRNGDLFVFKDKLNKGMLKNNYSAEFADRIFEQMKGFGSYGFPESHSASFAILAYFSAWLKRHHTAAFYCALLNSQPMGFYSPSQLIQDAIRHKIQVFEINIDHSFWQSEVLLPNGQEKQSVPKGIRLGFHLIKGFNKKAAQRIIAEREKQSFTNIKDLVFRSKLNSIEKNALIQANALPRLAKHRHQAQWQSLAIEEDKPLLTKLDSIKHVASQSELNLTTPTEIEDMISDYKSTGLTLNKHPIKIMREKKWLEPCKRACELKDLRHGQFIKVAGVVTGRQRPGTAAGVLFITLEDETGNMNIIVWKSTLEKFRRQILDSRLLLIKGKVEREKKVVHVIAGYIQDISEKLPEFKRHSRDFH